MSDISPTEGSDLGIDNVLLGRFVAGDCSAAEGRAVEQWLAASSQHTRELEHWRLAWERASTLLRARAAQRFDVPAGVARVLETVPPAADLTMGYPRQAPPSVHAGIWATRVTAAVAAAIGFVMIGLHLRTPNADPTFRELVTPPGNRTSVMLQDGTRLTLGPASRLRIPANFGVAGRRLDLDGEAVFTVVHDAAHPFTVHTARAVMQDIGTQFVVHAYGGDPEDHIAVIEGAVDVSLVQTSHDRQSLHAGDVLRLTDHNASIAHHIDAAAEAGWLQGRLVFNHIPFRDVVREVSRTFDVNVTLADSTLGHEIVTGDFSGKDVDEILLELTVAMGVHYDRSGKDVVIRHGPPNASKAKRPSSVSPTILIQGAHSA